MKPTVTLSFLVLVVAAVSAATAAPNARALLQATTAAPAECTEWTPKQIKCVLATNYRMKCEYHTNRDGSMEADCEFREVDGSAIDKSVDLQLDIKCPLAAGKVACANDTLLSLPAAAEPRAAAILAEWPAGPGRK